MPLKLLGVKEHDLVPLINLLTFRGVEHLRCLLVSRQFCLTLDIRKRFHSVVVDSLGEALAQFPPLLSLFAAGHQLCVRVGRPSWRFLHGAATVNDSTVGGLRRSARSSALEDLSELIVELGEAFLGHDVSLEEVIDLTHDEKIVCLRTVRCAVLASEFVDEERFDLFVLLARDAAVAFFGVHFSGCYIYSLHAVKEFNYFVS